MFELSHQHLVELCEANELPIDRSAMVFVGLRGCLPIKPFDHGFRDRQQLATALVNYGQPRCTLLQWRPAEGTFAAFPGSTVPHRKYIEMARTRGGMGCNQLLSGFWDDFRKGRHKGFSPTGHEAWLQTASRPYRRTVDDVYYDNLDRVEMVNPGDNLHAAWCAGLDTDFSGAGCQVVVGFPRCNHRGGQPNSGPWKAFHGNAWNLEQLQFGYVLLTGSEVERTALTGISGSERIRFGSSGPRTRRIQEALRGAGYYEGDLDGRFGPRSLRALLRFQEDSFGPGGDDGICGPQTAEVLKVAWP
jgi:hypothetical protein